MSQRETPSELFKRSLAQTTRALAGQEDELEVAFGAEGPKLAPGRMICKVDWIVQPTRWQLRAV